MIGLVVIIFAIIIMQLLTGAPPPNREMVYSEFLQRVKDHQVLDVVIAGNHIDGVTDKDERISVTFPDDPGLIKLLQAGERDDSGATPRR